MTSQRFSVIPAVYLYLRRGNTVLLQLRQNTGFMDGAWAAAAAGHVEHAETATAAIVREAREELGIALQAENLVPVTVMQRTDGTSAPEEQRVDWFFTASTWAGTPRIMEPRKCAALDWFPMSDLPTPMPGHERAVLTGLARGEVARFSDFGFDGKVGDP